MIPACLVLLLGLHDHDTSPSPPGAAGAGILAQVEDDDGPQEKLADGGTWNRPADGYRGIWYANQPSGDEYVYKYSGGLGTYCAKHSPHAVHHAGTRRTYFTYGGATAEDPRRLLHMVSYFDHAEGRVPRPTILLDKRTKDAHDNPVISLDRHGHVWIFSTSHGRARPSFVHRSRRPHDISEFERIDATFVDEDGTVQPLDNFSYLQSWYAGGRFLAFFTHYGSPADRTNFFMSSEDGVRWSRWIRLAAIEKGHYQISAVHVDPRPVPSEASRPEEEGGAGVTAASAFNYHPVGKGLNWRTNLYYMQTRDEGRSWQSVEGHPLTLPLVDADNPARVWDAESEGLKVYLKDLVFDAQGRPLLLCIASRGYQSGPENGPRRWILHAWDGEAWRRHEITHSDNNYDMGSLFLEGERWTLMAPTLPGPQAFNPGGEMAAWRSEDRGASWSLARTMTEDSPYNHGYARRPVDAHPDFVAFWADGHGRQPSESRLYFANSAGEVFRLPTTMNDDSARPERLSLDR